MGIYHFYITVRDAHGEYVPGGPKYLVPSGDGIAASFPPLLLHVLALSSDEENISAAQNYNAIFPHIIQISNARKQCRYAVSPQDPGTLRPRVT